MNQRENLLAILRREPFEWLPPEFNLCPSLVEEYKKRTGSDLPYQDYFDMPWRNAQDILLSSEESKYLPYHPNLKPGSTIDLWGVAHEPGSEAAKHMTYLRSPLRGIDSLEEVRAKVFEHMEIAKPFGGLLPAPTHLLEPEVPWENILAYVEACRDYRP